MQLNTRSRRPANNRLQRTALQPERYPKNMKRPHLKPVLEMLTRARCSAPPLPWRRQSTHAIGGLMAVGFGERSDLLLVVSSQGRGVFDCTTGG